MDYDDVQALPQVLALWKKVKQLPRALQVLWTYCLMLKKETGREILDMGFVIARDGT